MASRKSYRSRKAKPKNRAYWEHKSGIPDIVKENSTLESATPPRIAPPPLAVPDENTYWVDMPKIGDGPPPREAQPAALAKGVSRKTGKKTVAFVDYEHWFYSMEETLGVKPNIAEWYGDIAGDELLDVRFYADFSKEDLFRELPRIRGFSGTVLDTRSPNGRTEKNYTDFIILNDMYRLALTRGDIEKVILVSGDGHFSPAVGFLKTACGLEVEVFAVKGCVSVSQRMAATVLHELPGSLDYLLECVKDTLHYIRRVKAKAPWYNFCFMPLAEQVAKCYGYDIDAVKDSIETLIRKEYMRRTVCVSKGKTLSILEVDWDAVARDGIAPPEARYASTDFPGAADYDGGYEADVPGTMTGS